MGNVLDSMVSDQSISNFISDSEALWFIIRSKSPLSLHNLRLAPNLAEFTNHNLQLNRQLESQGQLGDVYTWLWKLYRRRWVIRQIHEELCLWLWSFSVSHSQKPFIALISRVNTGFRLRLEPCVHKSQSKAPTRNLINSIRAKRSSRCSRFRILYHPWQVIRQGLLLWFIGATSRWPYLKFVNEVFFNLILENSIVASCSKLST